MMETIKAFILAAGLGERLRPVTNHLPKPLLPVLGEPVIERLAKKVFSVPVDRVGVNAHYKAEMIYNWAETSSYAGRIELFNEVDILGTGGALKNAEHFLRGSTFLVHNADIVSDISLSALIKRHISEGNIATLAVHSHHHFSNVWIDEEEKLHSVGGNQPERRGIRRVAFTGIAVYSGEFLDLLPAGNSSVIDAWLRALKSGFRVGTVGVNGCRWTDIGTPKAYSSLIFSSLEEGGEVLYIHPSIKCRGVDLGAKTVVEQGCTIGRDTSIRSAILLPGARVDQGSHIENAIVGPDYVVNLEEPAVPSSLPSDLISGLQGESSGKISIAIIGVGGSDRNYYRIRRGNKTAVLMECSEDDPDYQRQIIYTHFFRKQLLPVPQLLGFHSGDSVQQVLAREGRIYLLFEDLGDISLYSWLKCQKEMVDIEALYRSVLDIMIALHTRVSENASECELLYSRVFDAEYLRWETDYFMKRYVASRGISIPDESLLSREFDRLAEHVDSFKKAVIHRDFQSQNVMVTKGNVPGIIDYQGARIGPPAYDLASLLWDPYAPIDTACRARLLEYYIKGVRDFYGSSFDEEVFRAEIIPCRLQRHMQALGAYGFLSAVKGRSYFFKYVPQALRYLKEDVTAVKNEYPLLFQLASGLDENIDC